MNEKKHPYMDWQQVVLNGGPPCFAVNIPHTIPNKYCGRAERWEGHGSKYGHEFVSLNDLLAAVQQEAQRSAINVLCVDCKAGDVPVLDEQVGWYYHGKGLSASGCPASKLRLGGVREGVRDALRTLEAAANSVQKDSEGETR